MRKQVKIWVMIADPAKQVETVPFIGKTIEVCMDKLHTYLNTYTGPGTRAEVVQSGYIYTGATNGKRRHTKKEQQSMAQE